MLATGQLGSNVPWARELIVRCADSLVWGRGQKDCSETGQDRCHKERSYGYWDPDNDKENIFGVPYENWTIFQGREMWFLLGVKLRSVVLWKERRRGSECSEVTRIQAALRHVVRGKGGLCCRRERTSWWCMCVVIEELVAALWLTGSTEACYRKGRLN